MIDYHTLCIHCLHEHVCLTPCPQCGYNEHHYKHHPLYLRPRTLLENQYILGKTLGQGGFGITYIGLDKWLQKIVAIKEYLPSTLATRDFQTACVIPLSKQETAFHRGLQTFIKEARNLARFNHPHIVRVLNFFQANHTGYMVMDYLDGHSPLTLLQNASGRLPVPAALAILLPILEALAEIHAQHIYHCDISIQNIRISANGTPVLIDFGAARQEVGEQSRSLAYVLKHGYAPLEQYSGKGAIGPWTDVYACGALLYLFLTGTLPPAAIDRLGTDTLVISPEITDSPVLNEALHRALALEPENRFQTAQEFKEALQGKTRSLILSVPQISQPTTQKNQRGVFQWVSVVLLMFLLLIPKNFTVPTGTHVIPQVAEKSIILKKSPVKTTPLQPTDLTPEKIEPRLPVDTPLQSQTALLKQIATLLQQANVNLASQRLESAYKTYQAVLALAPKNSEAQRGLEKIANHYIQLTKTQHANPTERLLAVNAGLALFPNQAALLSLQQELQALLNRQQHVENLLKKAEQQQRALRLTEPVGENAYETYQQILALVANHPQAKAGLEKIAQTYIDFARAESNNFQRKQFFIQKGLTIFPTHRGLLALNRELASPKNPPPMALPQPSKKLVIERPPEKIVIKEPEPSPVVVSVPATLTQPTDKIADLLATAERHLETSQWDATSQVYKNILALDQTNQQAIQGLKNIASHYEQLARDKRQQANFPASLAFIDQGLEADPHHTGLLALKKELTTPTSPPKPAAKLSESKAEPIIFTPTF